MNIIFVSFGYIGFCVIRLSFTHIPVKAPSCGWAARAAETPRPPRPPNSGRAVAGDNRPKAGWAMSGYALGTEVTELMLKGWSLPVNPNREPAPPNTHTNKTPLQIQPLKPHIWKWLWAMLKKLHFQPQRPKSNKGDSMSNLSFALFVSNVCLDEWKPPLELIWGRFKLFIFFFLS